MRATSSPAASVLMVCIATALLAACEPGVEPMPYSPPPVGTVYDYGGQTNTITKVDGWRTTYRDDVGREGTRLALFITEDPRRPFTPDSVAIGELWPLRPGQQTVVIVKRDSEEYRWEFDVTDTTTITVPAGTFSTFIVEGVEKPQLVRNPARAVTVSNRWWVAQPNNTVVRFSSTYLTGPAAGRQVVGELKAIRMAGASDSASRADSARAAPRSGDAASKIKPGR